MLICPSCKRVLAETSTASGATQFVCLDCGGRGLKLETLAVVLSSLTFKRLITGYNSGRRLGERVCPLCKVQMRAVPLTVLGQTKDVDVCGHSELAWFDSHEFENLPLTSAADHELKLPHDLHEALTQIETHHGQVVKNRSSFRLDANDYGFGWRDQGAQAPSLWRALISFALLLPIKREHRLASKPWATWITVAVVLAVTLYGFRHDPFVDRWALESDDLLRANGWTLLTYFFLHGSWMHVLGNLYYLIFFGDSVEDELGTKGFALALLAGTIGAAFVHAIFSPRGYSLLVGASGGISTLGMIYMLRFPRARLSFFILAGWIYVPAYLLCGIWVLMQINMAYQQVAGLTQVSALAHLGGALVGVAVYTILLRRPPHERAEV